MSILQVGKEQKGFFECYEREIPPATRFDSRFAPHETRTISSAAATLTLDRLDTWPPGGARAALTRALDI